MNGKAALFSKIVSKEEGNGIQKSSVGEEEGGFRQYRSTTKVMHRSGEPATFANLPKAAELQWS